MQYLKPGWRALVTGGAGFIGSHLVDALMERGLEVYVFDNLSAGSLRNLERWMGSPAFSFIKGDLLNPEDLSKLDIGRYGLIFHLAANPEVRVGSSDPEMHFQQNVVATKNLLELLRRVGSLPKLIFTSTSTVYGEADKIPTPEDYAPLKPISIYGASKLACEALVSAYAYTYGLKAVILRLANIVGSRSTHGVIHDLIQKLRRNPEKLEVLGDGTQTKSYLYISDCIEAILQTTEKSENQVEIYNIGSEDQINVKKIAQIIIQEMELENMEITYTGGVNGGRGWKGDVKKHATRHKQVESPRMETKTQQRTSNKKDHKTTTI